MAKIKDKVLLVEGFKDLLVIPELVEKGTGLDWGTRKNPIVFIKDKEGVEKLLKESTISLEMKESGLEIIGIIVDADELPEGRWQSVRNLFIDFFPDLPTEIPEDGFVVSSRNEDGIKFGAWIMPDNRNNGMMETFLGYLVPDRENNELLKFAKEVTQQAKAKGAPFTDAHTAKAIIHSWLAWQDEPGPQLHNAIQQNILKPDNPKAKPFLNWFVDLYELDQS